jgi:type IV secretory pathway ATPase VirB11/archaellum biosynthesis ATPase
VVLFSGPTGVGKTTLLNAHTPFVPFDHRPISIDEGSREVELPHETGVSLTTREHQQSYKRVSMADLMTQANYLNPDVEVIAEINSDASFQTFGEVLNTGHGVLGTTHAEDPATLVNRVIEQGLPPQNRGSRHTSSARSTSSCSPGVSTATATLARRSNSPPTRPPLPTVPARVG